MSKATGLGRELRAEKWKGVVQRQHLGPASLTSVWFFQYSIYGVPAACLAQNVAPWLWKETTHNCFSACGIIGTGIPNEKCRGLQESEVGIPAWSGSVGRAPPSLGPEDGV